MKSIVSIKETEMDGAFAFKVLPSNNDSIRNFTLKTIQTWRYNRSFFPSISTDERYMVHPFARSGWVGEANYMKSRARLKGGEAILFTIPVSWDVNRITDRNDKKRFQAGRLLSGKYRIGLQLEIYMDTEFEVK